MHTTLTCVTQPRVRHAAKYGIYSHFFLPLPPIADLPPARTHSCACYRFSKDHRAATSPPPLNSPWNIFPNFFSPNSAKGWFISADGQDIYFYIFFFALCICSALRFYFIFLLFLIFYNSSTRSKNFFYSRMVYFGAREALHPPLFVTHIRRFIIMRRTILIADSSQDQSSQCPRQPREQTQASPRRRNW